MQTMHMTAGRWVLAGIVVAVALPYAIAGREPHRLDAAARAAHGGEFVRLSAGHTHYEAAGPAADQVTVLVHGTTVPSFVWDANFGALADAGLRVVRYDLYGRGLSDRVPGPYDLPLFVRQLEELVEHVAPDARVNLVGASLGGMIISEYARQNPERVSGLVLIDPAGVGTELPPAAKAALAPGVGEYVMRVLGSRQLRPARRMLAHPERQPAFDSLYLSTLSIDGSRRAILSTLRSVQFDGYGAGFDAVRRLRIPTLLIWGREDTIVPFHNSERVKQLLVPQRFVPVQDAGHFPNVDQPAPVNRELIMFLQRRAAEQEPGGGPTPSSDVP